MKRIHRLPRPSTRPSHSPYNHPSQVVVIDGERYTGLAPSSANCGDGPSSAIGLDAVLRACAIDRTASKGPLIKAEAGVPVLGAEGTNVATQWRARSRMTVSSRASSDCSDAEEGADDDGKDEANAAAGGSHHDRLVLLPQGGLVSLSGLRCCASSEAVLQGKGSRFRLVLRAVDASTGAPLSKVRSVHVRGEGGQMRMDGFDIFPLRLNRPRLPSHPLTSLFQPLTNPNNNPLHHPQVGHVITGPFLVATRRMKQALKRDTPCTIDEISRLHHIGRATAEKLRNLATSAAAEGVDLPLPAELSHVERVGQFAQLTALVADDPSTRVKLLQLLKLSAANWAEAAAHAAGAVPPDSRRRLFAGVAGGMNIGLLYDARMGALLADVGPSAVVYPDGTEVALRCVDARLVPLLPALKEQALRQWRLAGHPGWGIYGRDELATAAGDKPASSAGGALTATQSGAVSAAAAVAVQQAVARPPSPVEAASLHIEDNLKRIRSQTTERRATDMVEARARLLTAIRQESSGGGAVSMDGGVAAAAAAAASLSRSDTMSAGGHHSAPVSAVAAAPWEVDVTDNDPTTLLNMYHRWQQGSSLSMPSGANLLGAAPTTSTVMNAAAVPPPPTTAAVQQRGSFSMGMMAGAYPRFALMPGDVEAMLSDGNHHHPTTVGAAPAGGAYPHSVVHSAPLAAPPSGGGMSGASASSLVRCLSVPRGLDAPHQSAAGAVVGSPAAPWLVVEGDGSKADGLCRGLRQMSFEINDH